MKTICLTLCTIGSTIWWMNIWNFGFTLTKLTAAIGFSIIAIYYLINLIIDCNENKFYE
jgi:hypothetical protein